MGPGLACWAGYQCRVFLARCCSEFSREPDVSCCARGLGSAIDQPAELRGEARGQVGVGDDVGGGVGGGSDGQCCRKCGQQ
ncbi:hypothetical protein CTAM01_04520 [Colletotrichum tamarilloi]|uniref:Uncharacterized protein n=1 Tax=Colletotrichum tamarilloi TaxID=1209934 RepID=A0ABQ9RGG3_9PEZI|nr:uncharacterized protein CTAM01_04520 [Colletotrichum tamarilloi]KAK1503208.1 hypothetical protein CTAM01_04520 [Colletotrichum tamarilloi]